MSSSTTERVANNFTQAFESAKSSTDLEWLASLREDDRVGQLTKRLRPPR